MTSAGEVEQFAYCPHNWWLARQGVDPETRQSRSGVADHAAHATGARQAEGSRRDMRSGLGWSFRILAVAASVTFLTLEVVYLRAEPLHWVFLTTALVLVSASAGLLTVALDAERRMRRLQQRHHLVPGDLVDSDDGQAELLVDPDWGISGRPDQVMRTDHGLVPVEVKSGRTPDRPFEGHVLQLGCYLRLLEARHGTRPEYGLLNYPEGVFRVAWDEDLQERVRRVLARIGEAEQAGRADRDHQHVGRCRGCARRDACDQRLA